MKIPENVILEAREFVIEMWEKDGEAVVAECAKLPSLDMNCDQFLSHCCACGGNWGGMLLTGIRKLRPTVWDAIPDDMGPFAWHCLCQTLILCGVDTRG